MYNVYTPPKTFGADYFTTTPVCGHPLEYQIRIKDLLTGLYSPLSSFIDNPNDLDFSVFTDDPSSQATYHISIVASVPVMYQSPVYSEELVIELDI